MAPTAKTSLVKKIASGAGRDARSFRSTAAPVSTRMAPTSRTTSIGRGFKSGSYNIRANTLAAPVADHPIADEVLDTFEFGSKSSFADGRFALNAANEVAVAAFIGKKIRFGAIARLVEATLEKWIGGGNLTRLTSADDAIAVDHNARNLAASLLPQIAAKAS